MHERYLQTVHNDNTLSCEELLKSDDSISIHTQNLNVLSVKLCKTVYGFSPDVTMSFYLIQILLIAPENEECSTPSLLKLFILDLKHYKI